MTEGRETFCPPERFGSCRAAGAASVRILFKFERRSVIATERKISLNLSSFPQILFCQSRLWRSVPLRFRVEIVHDHSHREIDS